MDNLDVLLSGALYFMVAILIILIGVYVYVLCRDKFSKAKEKQEEKEKNTDKMLTEQSKAKTEKPKTETMGNVLDFMDFEEIEDNMIVNKAGKKYTMVLECKGINYDLLSGIEQAAVEEAFIQFLNALRFPIQIHVQTRTVNLEANLEEYRRNIEKNKIEYKRKKLEYDSIKANPNIDIKVKQKAFIELTKLQNLLEYAEDVIEDTQRISLNRNILTKKYYISFSYHYETPVSGEKLDNKDIRDLAFQDLYTRAATIISSLSSTGVVAYILNSYEIAEMLYMAFNREGAEEFGLKRALQANYDKLYSTAPDVFGKKLRELDKEIESKAILKAQEKIQVAYSIKEQELIRKEKEKDKLINDMAKMILESNKKYIGKEIAQIAVGEIENEKQNNLENTNNVEGVNG